VLGWSPITLLISYAAFKFNFALHSAALSMLAWQATILGGASLGAGHYPPSA